MAEPGLAWGKKQTPNPPPRWCAKSRPCDYDRACFYCPHRECRAELMKQYAELLLRLEQPSSEGT